MSFDSVSEGEAVGDKFATTGIGFGLGERKKRIKTIIISDD